MNGPGPSSTHRQSLRPSESADELSDQTYCSDKTWKCIRGVILTIFIAGSWVGTLHLIKVCSLDSTNHFTNKNFNSNSPSAIATSRSNLLQPSSSPRNTLEVTTESIHENEEQEEPNFNVSWPVLLLTSTFICFYTNWIWLWVESHFYSESNYFTSLYAISISLSLSLSLSLSIYRSLSQIAKSLPGIITNLSKVHLHATVLPIVLESFTSKSTNQFYCWHSLVPLDSSDLIALIHVNLALSTFGTFDYF